MRILVIEDTEKHILAAQKQLVDHQVTICKTFREAERILAGADIGCWYKEDAEFPFDAVLTDLYLPLSLEGIPANPVVGRTDTGESITKPAIEAYGAQIPYAVVIALAATRRGKPVAIVTDGGHHSHPMNWALDLVNTPRRLMLGITPFLMTDRGVCGFDDELGYVKQWHKMLEILMKED